MHQIHCTLSRLPSKQRNVSQWTLYDSQQTRFYWSLNNTHFIKKCFLGNDLVTVIPFSVKDRRKYTLCEFNIDQGHFIIFLGGREGGKHPV